MAAQDVAQERGIGVDHGVLGRTLHLEAHPRPQQGAGGATQLLEEAGYRVVVAADQYAYTAASSSLGLRSPRRNASAPRQNNFDRCC